MPVGWAEKTKRHEVEEEGVQIRDASELNFVGAGVTVTEGDKEIVVTIPGGGVPAAHDISHQDGGVDEISVTGLAGLLTTEQTPIVHDHTGDPGDGGALAAYSVSGHAHGSLYYTEAEVDDLLTSIQAKASGSFVVDGGDVTWETGLQFRVSAARYYINGVLYGSIEQTITLDAAHITDDRIDVIGLDDTGTVIKITGTAGASPSRPDIDPATQLHLTFVLVPGGSATPGDISTAILYQENLGTPTEWNATDSGATIDVNSTNNPRTGTKTIEATTAINNNWFNLAAAAPLSIADYDKIIFNIRSKAAWPGAKSLRVSFRLSGVVVGSYVSIDDGLFGFDSATLGAYQQVAIPMSSFSIPPGSNIDSVTVEIRGGGAAIGFYVDDILLQGGVPQGASGMTIEEADARYRKLVDDVMSVEIVFDGGGAEIALDTKVALRFYYACTINAWAIGAPLESGSIVIDLWKDTHANFPPTDADSITNTNEPEIVTAQAAEDTDLSNWSDVTVDAGDWIIFNVDSVTTVTLVTLALKITRT